MYGKLLAAAMAEKTELATIVRQKGKASPGNRSTGTASTAGSGAGVPYSDDPMMAIRWFHPYLTRHAADCMLIDNAPEGSYLLRPSSDGEGYVVCVKLSSSVQHIRLTSTRDGKYKFGNSSFESIENVRKHFEFEMPVIGGDSGVTVVLKHPYTRFVEESHMYTDVVHHAVTHMLDSSSETEDDSVGEFSHSGIVREKTLAVASKEGYLTKLGRIRKTWRVRWFTLRNQHFCYYKTKQSPKPLGTMDMTRARTVEYDNSKQKDFCFRIAFPYRTYYFYANSAEDSQQWVELLRSKLM